MRRYREMCRIAASILIRSISNDTQVMAMRYYDGIYRIWIDNTVCRKRDRIERVVMETLVFISNFCWQVKIRDPLVKNTLDSKAENVNFGEKLGDLAILGVKIGRKLN